MNSGAILIFSIDGSHMGGTESVLRQIACYWQKERRQIHVVFLSKRQGNQWKSTLGNEHVTYAYFSVKTLFPLLRHRLKYILTSHTRTI
jgi:hypothetical protein